MTQCMAKSVEMFCMCLKVIGTQSAERVYKLFMRERIRGEGAHIDTISLSFEAARCSHGYNV